jgi:hypothetical protein
VVVDEVGVSGMAAFLKKLPDYSFLVRKELMVSVP